MIVSGLDELEATIEKIGDHQDYIAKHAVYLGAGVIANAIKAEIKKIPEDHGRGNESHKLTGITKTQKAGLESGLFISKMNSDAGTTYVTISFNGYNEVKTNSHPNGQPNILVAREVESGTSWMQKHPFIRTAINRVKSQAIKAMQAGVSEAVKELQGEK